jgi:hypothetical protein
MIARIAIFLVSAAFTSAFFIQFCATVFQCGCQAMWSTGAQFCNIHEAHGKHCPWCVYGTTGYALVYGSMLAAQAAVSFWPVGWPRFGRLAGALVAFPVVGAVLAVTMGLITGYWN